MKLPDDPYMLLSVINMKLRDFYLNMDELCEDMCVKRGDINRKLAEIGFEYDEKLNRYIKSEEKND